MNEKENMRDKTIYLAYKYKLILKEEQKAMFSQWAGNCRYIYNWALALKDSHYKEKEENLQEFEISHRLILLKKEAEKTWLKSSPSQTLQQTIKDLNRAYTNFFKKRADFPKFKKKGRSRDSFRFPDPKGFSFQKLNKNKASLSLPKVGRVKIFYSRPLEGILRNATVSREGKDWYISLCTEKNLQYKTLSKREIGIDRGITHTLATSEGKFFDLPKESLKKLEKRKAFLQRRFMKNHKVEKRENWSKNKLKKQEAVKKIDLKLKRIRHDWMHKTSTQLAKNHSLIVLEDLNIKGMMKSAKGTLEEKGKKVAQKRGLNRSIAREAWGIFETQLSYKMDWVDSLCVKIDPKYSSQECSSCSFRSKENRESQSIFVCKSCGHKENADINASLNLLKWYKKTPLGEGEELGELSLEKEALNQEPLKQEAILVF